MKLLLIFRNRIESLYNMHSGIVDFAGRLLVSFLIILTVKQNLGFNALLSQIWFVIAYSIICASIKGRLLTLVIGAYTVMQLASLSTGVAVTVLIIMLIMYFMYFRLRSKYGFVLLLMMLSCILKIPMAVTFVLATAASVDTIFVVICGNIVYYMLHYISVNSAVLTGYAQSGEIATASVFINGMVSYKEFIYALFISAIVFLIVCFVRKINMNHANDMAVSVGAGAYIILSLITSMIIGTLTFPRLRAILLGTVCALIIALVIEKVILPLDFDKAEYVEFEDEEYHYYVRAVPKVTMDKESVRVTRINSRGERAAQSAPDKAALKRAKKAEGNEKS